MTETELFNSLSKIVDSNLLNSLKGSSITKQGNVISMFEKYTLRATPTGCKLMRLTDGLTIDFSSLKSAVTWATFDNTCKISDCSRVLFLETMLAGLEFDQNLYEKYSRKAESKEKKLTYFIKLQETKMKKRLFIEELEGFSFKAKRLQVSQFERSSYK